MTHQRDTMFGIWYTYDANGRDQWLTGTARDPNGSNVFTGELRRLTGLPFANINGAQAFTTIPVVGTISFSITSGTTGSMTYTLDGVTQTKPLRRYVFGTPVSICRSGSG